MRPATALNIRRLGRIIEAVCLLAAIPLFRKNTAGPELVPGVPLYWLLVAGFGFGFILWCVGTVAYQRARQRGEV